MMSSDTQRVAYVVSRFRAGDVQLAAEIAAHETAGLGIEIISLEPQLAQPNDSTAFSRKVSVTYLPHATASTQNDTEFNRTQKLGIPAVFLAALTCDRAISHLHATSAGVAADVARLSARMARITYSVAIRGQDVFADCDVGLLRQKLAGATAVFVGNEFNVHQLRAKYGESIRFRRYDVDTDLLGLHFNSLANREPLIVARANQKGLAGIADLIEACRILQRRHCPFRCEIHGDVASDSQLSALIEAAGLKELVTLIAAPSNFREAIARAAVFADLGEDAPGDASVIRHDLHALRDLREAMALGTPCLITDYSAGAELIKDGETGIIEPRHYPEALAISLQRLFSDSSLRQRLAVEARQMIHNLCDVQANAKRMRDAFGATQPARVAVGDAMLQHS